MIGLSVQLSGEATFGVGVSGSMGLTVSIPVPLVDPDAKADIGVIGTISGRAGYLVGAGVEVSGYKGDVQGQNGVAAEATIGAGPLAPSVSKELTKPNSKITPNASSSGKLPSVKSA